MINQSTLIIILLLSAATFALPRKLMLIPFIVAACFVPTDQRIVISDLHFTALRILVVVGIARIYIRAESTDARVNRFDKLVLAWAAIGAGIYVVQWGQMQALINRSGFLFDVLGLYWIFRQNIGSWNQLAFVMKIFAVCAIVMSGFVAYEWATGHNPFMAIGMVGTNVRDGQLRCQASFPHSIMLGVFWAVLMPLFVSLAKLKISSGLFWTATGASSFILMATASSTPLLTIAAGVGVLAVYDFRHLTRNVVKVAAVMLFLLHFIMEPPVWHLLARMDVIAGSTGWHRYNLIDQAVRNIGEWAVIGTQSTAHWGLFLDDVTNQYLLEGFRGGLITMVLFLVMFFIAFRIALDYSTRVKSSQLQWFCWSIFAMLFAHAVGFFGVSYFGQTTMLWYFSLAVIGFMAEYKPLPQTQPQPQQSQPAQARPRVKHIYAHFRSPHVN